MANTTTGTWEQTPRGVTYTREHVEYQEFPEEFFSGADCVIYFGDTFIEDISNLQFTIAEKVRPIYGYASYTWDAIARGSRLVQGSFRIVFRESGYLFKTLERLGEIAARTGPALGRMLAGQDVPDWHAGAMQTIEELIGGRSSPLSPDFIVIRRGEYEVPPVKKAIVAASLLAEKLNMTLYWNQSDRSVIMGGRALKPYSIENDRAYFLLHIACEALGYSINWHESDQSISIWRGSERVATINKGEYRLLQEPGGRSVMWSRDLAQRLGMPVEWNGTRRTVVLGGKEFKPHRVDQGKAYVFVREVAEGHGYYVYWHEPTRDIYIIPPGGGVITPDEYKTISGQDRAVVPVSKMASLLDTNDYKVEADGVYFFGRRFERVDGVYSTPGVYVREVLENLGYSVYWMPDTKLIVYYNRDAVPRARPDTGEFKKSMADYEAEIWGDPMVPERERQRQRRPYFYGSPKEAPLLEQGFDLYIVYGPLPHHVKNRLDALPDYITYNTTVKAIRNVQLMSCAQILDPTGQPVQEEYTFIARDLD